MAMFKYKDLIMSLSLFASRPCLWNINTGIYSSPKAIDMILHNHSNFQHQNELQIVPQSRHGTHTLEARLSRFPWPQRADYSDDEDWEADMRSSRQHDLEELERVDPDL